MGKTPGFVIRDIAIEFVNNSDIFSKLVEVLVNARR
jgi:hypothetical protein